MTIFLYWFPYEILSFSDATIRFLIDICFPINKKKISFIMNIRIENTQPTSIGFGEEAASIDAVVFEILSTRFEIASFVLSLTTVFNKSFKSVSFSQFFSKSPISVDFFFSFFKEKFINRVFLTSNSELQKYFKFPKEMLYFAV